jgi:hypothetical protein
MPDPEPTPDVEPMPAQPETSSQVSDLFEDDAADEVLTAISVVETSTSIVPGLSGTAVVELTPIGDVTDSSKPATASASIESEEPIASRFVPAALSGDGVDVELSLQEAFQVVDVVDSAESTGSGPVSESEPETSDVSRPSEMPPPRTMDDKPFVTRMNDQRATENLSRSDTEATDRAVRLLNLPGSTEISSPSPDQIGGFLRQAILLIKGGDSR